MTEESAITEASKLKKEGKLAEAELLLKEINKGSYKANYLLGDIYQEQGKFSKAAFFYKKALEINPNYMPALNDYAVLLKKVGKSDEAVKQFTKALDIKPDFRYFSNLLFSLNYSDTYDASAKFECTLLYEKFLKKLQNLESGYNYETVMQNSSKIKIGYISSDFKAHSVAYFISPILENYNRNIFDVYCYSDVINPDKTTEYFMKLVDNFVDITNKNNDELYQEILKDKIDILVDLTGHTDGGKRLPVFSRRAAPIQVNYIGYPNTTGIQNMDYRITDWYTDDEKSQKYYTETLVRLYKSFLCFNYPHNLPEVKNSNVTLKKNEENIVFVNFNNYVKFTDNMIKAWGKILYAVPNSRLMIKNGVFSDKEIVSLVEERFAKLGVKKEKLILLSHMYSTVEHLEKYNEAHIALDTYPYCGTTTTFEAMIMGVPVITLAGNEHLSRVGKSILTNAGLEELVAYNIEDYVEKAVSLANDRERLYEIKKSLRSRMIDSILLNKRLFTSEYEKVLKGLWNICSYKQVYSNIEKNDKLVISDIIYIVEKSNELTDTIIEALQYIYNLTEQNLKTNEIGIITKGLEDALISLKNNFKFLTFRNKELRELFEKLDKAVNILYLLLEEQNYSKFNEVIEDVFYKGICIIKEILNYEYECVKYAKSSL